MKTLGLLKNSMYYSLKFRWAIFHPKVYNGYFSNTSQQNFFDALLASGFERTRFQLIFKGQIAGLIKKTNQNQQYHIRFYEDGSIDCELEYNKFSLLHWSDEKDRGIENLQNILKDLNLDESIKTNISQNFIENRKCC